MRLIALVAVLAMALGLAAVAQEGKTYGKGVGAAEVVKVSELVSNPEKFVGRSVRVEGVVVDVCAKRGCWMDIKADGEKIRIKVDDGVIVFPMDAKGKHVIAEGVFTKIETTPEEAHADAPAAGYQIAGTGAVIS